MTTLTILCCALFRNYLYNRSDQFCQCPRVVVSIKRLVSVSQESFSVLSSCQFCLCVLISFVSHCDSYLL